MERAIARSSGIAKINRSDIIVSGDRKSRRCFVAINDTPQKITAGIGNKYLIFFKFTVVLSLTGIIL